MRLIALSLSLALVGCAAESSWKFHDAHGWPQPTWARTPSSAFSSDPCPLGGAGPVVAPDAYSTRQAVTLSQCGVVFPGYHERVAVYDANVAKHYSR